MLNFPEEVVFLLPDDRNGSFLPIPEWSMLGALPGAVSMDLALADRIDTDLESLVLVEKQPTGDPLLDPVLERIAAARDVHDARCRVENTAAYAAEIRKARSSGSSRTASRSARRTGSSGCSARAAIRPLTDGRSGR